MHRQGKIWITIILIVAMLGYASAERLFPGMNDIFGTALPSVGLAIDREAAEKSNNADEKLEIYSHFTDDDYDLFGQYLAGVGARVEEYKIDGTTMTATIVTRGASMIFSYDWSKQIGSATYSSGTRPETELEDVKREKSILPPVHGTMPSAEFAIDRKPDAQVLEGRGIVQTWSHFSDEDYTAFSIYLAETGAELTESNIDTGVLTAKIGLNGCEFNFVFDWNSQLASIIYPEGTLPEMSRWNTMIGKGFVLPSITCFGQKLPSISLALNNREPYSIQRLEDGSIQEEYSDFSEEDYGTFSQYLSDFGCEVEDYIVTDDKTIEIRINHNSSTFVFAYNPIRKTGIIIYPANTRIEKEWPENMVHIYTTNTNDSADSDNKDIESNNTVRQSILSEKIIQDLISSSPMIASSIKNTRELYELNSDYLNDFQPNDKVPTWRILINQGVVIISDESESEVLLFQASGKANELLPVLKWEKELIESIPDIYEKADLYGCKLFVQKVVDADSDYSDYADKDGKIDLLDETIRNKVLTVMEGNIVFLTAIGGTSQ